jgi:hypothetical protein
MVVENSFSNCNGSATFSAWVAIGSIKVKIWNKELLTRFQMCLRKQSDICMQVLQLFIEFIALPLNTIRIKCYDFEGPVNSSGHFVS